MGTGRSLHFVGSAVLLVALTAGEVFVARSTVILDRLAGVMQAGSGPLGEASLLGISAACIVVNAVAYAASVVLYVRRGRGDRSVVLYWPLAIPVLAMVLLCGYRVVAIEGPLFSDMGR